MQALPLSCCTGRLVRACVLPLFRAYLAELVCDGYDDKRSG